MSFRDQEIAPRIYGAPLERVDALIIARGGRPADPWAWRTARDRVIREALDAGLAVLETPP